MTTEEERERRGPVGGRERAEASLIIRLVRLHKTFAAAEGATRITMGVLSRCVGWRGWWLAQDVHLAMGDARDGSD